MWSPRLSLTLVVTLAIASWPAAPVRARSGPAAKLQLNEQGYFSAPGADVMVFQDVYPEGHQGGVGIIQNGVRVATNGDVRLEPAPGQWAPVPVQKDRAVDRAAGEIVTTLAYPDPEKDRKGFNPIEYPDLRFSYKVRVRAEGAAVRVTVDLAEALPAAWIGRVGFNLELYPGALFGRTFYAGDGAPGDERGTRAGLFPRQPNGPVRVDADHEVQPEPLATGHRLVVAPEEPAQQLTIESAREPLALLDGRINHPNGWFVVRALIPAGATARAIDWLITPHALPGWRSPPVVHVSQVGYHPAQRKVAVIETDPADTGARRATLIRIGEDGRRETMLAAAPRVWGRFLRYRYLQFDFSTVRRDGVYQIEYGPARTEPFRIARDVYKRGVWQPTLGTFLPVQMCHMRVLEKYRVWHGLCHMDDARMAEPGYTHFDGYAQGPSTLTKWKPLQQVAGLAVGGWHDAGDDDLRIESQAGEVYVLTLAHEAFGVPDDDTTIDERRRLVEIRQPDGKPDILQQIQHGLLGVVGAWKALGRFPRGVIVPTLRQYRMIGDIADQTDNLFYDPDLAEGEHTSTTSARFDDRLVFTEQNPARALTAAAYVAAGARAMRGFDAALAADALRAAEETWRAEGDAAAGAGDDGVIARLHAATELFLTTGKDDYRRALIDGAPAITAHVDRLGWIIGRALRAINDQRLLDQVHGAVRAYEEQWQRDVKETPFGIPYRPVIWGAAWGIQDLGVRQYFLHQAFPDVVAADGAIAALDFVLGVHPGSNTASFASGVGARSMTTAYGWNRADWSYIPGGVVSGTNLIRPDFPELKDFPFLWQQGEYVIGGGASHFMFLVLAADRLLDGAPAD
jgi:endoglucanase